MNITEALDRLKHQEAFQEVQKYVATGRDETLRDLITAVPDAQPTMVGKLAAYQELYELMCD
jgi:hypothetical protein